MSIAFAILTACLWTTASANEGFARIQLLVRADEAAELESVLPDDAFAPWRDEEADALRTALAKELGDAEVVKIREEEGRAVVRYRLPNDQAERELPLRLAGETWQVAAARGFPVDGPDLKQRKGRKAGKAKLTMRTENGPYRDCAFSFVHATGDSELCANRMDLWYCHNGDLHGIGDNRLADLGKTTLKKIRGLPVAADWADTVQLREKHSYVVHCRSRGRADFFVVLYVKKQKGQSAEVEWTLLTGGLAPPASITEPWPVAPDTPADGWDGLCGKNG